VEVLALDIRPRGSYTLVWVNVPLSAAASDSFGILRADEGTSLDRKRARDAAPGHRRGADCSGSVLPLPEKSERDRYRIAETAGFTAGSVRMRCASE
jgi:hypothetical protein